MTVSVAGKPIVNTNSLSNMARLALAFVDGGPEWLNWAVASPSARHDFPDETELAATVQFELHASRFTLLPHLGLSVSPVKLMTLSLADLQTLARAEGGDDSQVIVAQVQRILADHGLVTRDDLAAGTALLNRFGVGDSPVFQVLDFEERLALYGLTQMPGDGDSPLGQEAAAFAVSEARTPLEFADYYRFYLALAGKPGASDGSPVSRQEGACATLRTLLPLLFEYLGGPRLDAPPPPAEVARALADCFARGGRVGFSRLSDGARQIVEHTDFRNETGAEARHLVERYVSDAGSFLSSHSRITGRMGQDGTPSYEVGGDDRRVELRLGSTGGLSLADFCRLLPQ